PDNMSFIDATSRHECTRMGSRYNWGSASGNQFAEGGEAEFSHETGDGIFGQEGKIVAINKGGHDDLLTIGVDDDRVAPKARKEAGFACNSEFSRTAEVGSVRIVGQQTREQVKVLLAGDDIHYRPRRLFAHQRAVRDGLQQN